MSIRIRRGLEANRTGITPDDGEPIFTTDEKKLYVGDGTTPGGVAISTGGGGAVDSVNGQTGVVTLSASDVSADALGSATTAETNAKSYADTKLALKADKTQLFSGSYNDLTSKPTLGTAASQSSASFATAAQGAKADSAVQTETDPTVPAWAKTPSKPSYTKTDVGLGNVDNTSDVNKPVSTATASAITTASTADRNRANHTGTQSADTITDGTTNKVYTATEKTKLAAITGTNTGDETASTIKTKLGVTTLSGSNTGDQDLSSYATTSSVTTGLAGKQDTLVSATNIKTVNGTTLLGSGDLAISGGGGYDGTTLTPSANLTYNVGTPSAYYSNLYAQRNYLNSTAYIDGANAGTLDLYGRVNMHTASINIGDYIYTTTSSNTNAGQSMSIINRNGSSGVFGAIGAFAGYGDYLYLADRNPTFTVTTNYGSANHLFNGNVSDNLIVPVSGLASTPLVITVVKKDGSNIVASDVTSLILTSHRLNGGAYTGILTDYKVETQGVLGTWTTELQRTGVADTIEGALSIPLHVVGGTYDDGGDSGYHFICGVRLTVSGATASTIDGTNLWLSSIQMRDSRPSMTPATGFGALDLAGGTLLGNLGVVGNVTVSANNIITDTTTGTKIGTATNQKLGFFNATPVVQQSATADLGTTLSNLGLRASGTAYPLTTTGSVSFGQATVTSLRTNYVAKTAAYTVAATDNIVNCTSGTYSITLPTAVSIAGRSYTIKNSGTGAITVATTSSQTIDGSTTYALATQYKYVVVTSNGANWIITGSN